MKPFIITIALFFSFNAFSQSKVSAEPEWSEPYVTTEDLEGVWILTSFTYYQNNVPVDVKEIEEGYKQVKIYKDGHVMWTRQMPVNDIEWYGFGVYHV